MGRARGRPVPLVVNEIGSGGPLIPPDRSGPPTVVADPLRGLFTVTVGVMLRQPRERHVALQQTYQVEGLTESWVALLVAASAIAPSCGGCLFLPSVGRGMDAGIRAMDDEIFTVKRSGGDVQAVAEHHLSSRLGLAPHQDRTDRHPLFPSRY